MSLADVANNYQPKENQEFGNKKKLIGDAVCEVKLESITSKKSNKEWYILKGEVINAIPDEKGRETTVEVGDEISRLYDPTDDESIQELMDDLFTSGVTYEKGATDKEIFDNMKKATDGKLVYFRTWAKTKTPDQQAKKPDAPNYFQNIKILSVNKITAENSVRQLAF